MSVVNVIALILVLIGALNWGLVAFFQYNVVEAILGQTMATTIVYAIIGIAGVWGLSFLGKCKALCGCCRK